MRNTILLVIAAWVLGGSSAFPEDKPKHPDYFPAKTGMHWAYTGGGTVGTPRPIVVRVSKIEKVEGGLDVTTETTSDLKNWIRPRSYRVNGTGVTLTHENGEKLPKPIPQIKYPFKEDDKWFVETTQGGKKCEIAFSVGKVEKVKVPLGEFDAIPVTEVTTIDGKSEKETIWYAADKGIVKYIMYLGKKDIAGFVLNEIEIVK